MCSRKLNILLWLQKHVTSGTRRKYLTEISTWLSAFESSLRRYIVESRIRVCDDFWPKGLENVVLKYTLNEFGKPNRDLKFSCHTTLQNNPGRGVMKTRCKVTCDLEKVSYTDIFSLMKGSILSPKISKCNVATQAVQAHVSRKSQRFIHKSVSRCVIQC